MSDGWLVEARISTMAEPGEVTQLFYVREEDRVAAERALLRHLGEPDNARISAVSPVLETVLDDLKLPQGAVMELP